MLSYCNLGVKYKYDLILLLLEMRFLYNVHRHNFLKSDVSLKNPFWLFVYMTSTNTWGKIKALLTRLLQVLKTVELIVS